MHFSYLLESEIADIDANIISNDNLVMPKLILSNQNSAFSIQTYPNPFSNITNVEYDLPEDLNVIVGVYNVLGEKIITLINGNQKVGKHIVKFDGDRKSTR